MLDVDRLGGNRAVKTDSVDNNSWYRCIVGINQRNNEQLLYIFVLLFSGQRLEIIQASPDELYIYWLRVESFR